MKRKVTISLTLSLLVVSPLLLGLAGETFLGSANSYTPPPAKIGIDTVLAAVPTQADDKTDTPLPDRLIVRFLPTIAASLYTALKKAANADPRHNPTMIGNRLEAEVLQARLPQLADIFRQFQVRAADAIDPIGGAYLLRVQKGVNVAALRESLDASQNILYSEFDYPVRAFKDPNDPFYQSGRQWGLAQIDAPDAWDIISGTKETTLAIVDSGVGSHPELAGRILNGFNFVSDPASLDTDDDNGHGTYVAGIAAAKGDNNQGIAGVDWNATILPVKVLNNNGVGTNSTIAMGIRYAADQGANVINLSLGGANASQVVQEAVTYAAYPVAERVSRAESASDRAKAEHGAVLVASVANKSHRATSDNNNAPNPTYPAAYDEVLAIGATDGQDAPIATSDYGPELALCAPGYSILSLDWKSDTDTPSYSLGSGTSSATPFVAGTISLMLALNPHLNFTQVRNILEGTADFKALDTTTPHSTTTATATPIINADGADKAMTATTPSPRTSADGRTYDPRIGWGRLNSYKAVLAVVNGTNFPNLRARVDGTVTGLAATGQLGLAAGNVMISLTPGDQRFPDANGNFSFDNLPPGTYSLQATATKFGLMANPIQVQIDGAENETKTYNFNFSEANSLLFQNQPVGAFAPVTANPLRTDDENYAYFPDTHHSLTNDYKFKDFWDNNGSWPIFGFPISQPFAENGRTVQYFERAVFEYHSEDAGTKNEVQLALLGNLLTAQRSQEAPFKTLAPFPNSDNRHYFYQTGHSLSSSISSNFLKYWQNNNGALVFGFPTSEAFPEKTSNGQTYIVQYFERARMEWHLASVFQPAHVELSLLGFNYAQAQGMLGK